tara:strand:+ start:7114 stop:7278 length:165 start_codon:yes stop_codon:yes gene_type:complete
MPNPLKMYNENSIGTEVTKPDESSMRGAKNKVNIIMVFTTIVTLALRLLLLVLK